MLSQIKHNALYVSLKEGRKALKRRWALPKFRGDEYTCPVCGTQLRAFKPIWRSFMRAIDAGHPYPFKSLQTFNWQSYSCPACDASDRERLFMLYLDRIAPSLDPGRRHRLVEFAPSPTLRRKLTRHPRLEYRSADLYRRSVDDRIDIADMAYQDESVDIFICSHILEHVPQDRNAMRELHRVLKPGGFGIVMVPLINGVDSTDEDLSLTSREERNVRYGDGDHVRQYGIRDFRDRLEAASFQVELLGRDFFGAEAFRKAGIADDSVLYVVRKAGRPELRA
jgi:SAM-dependent methyltransferase